MLQMEIGIRKLKPNARIPDQTFTGDAGFDLYSNVAAVINPGRWLAIGTGLSLILPMGIHAEVRPRSGLSLKHGVTVLNAPGTVDSGYRGEIRVVLINHGTEPFAVDPGDGIAQLVFSSHEDCSFNENTHCEASDRGIFGFGSGKARNSR